ncbi:MAG: Uncharacterized protein G01um10148_42 [Parcubacteria group bacterium Gr01-1014_8]|nr:MAG: Uncharacterized protein G01um10148_42 [Parcubacteria group bacterium Gr01-1014_8]
MRVLSFVVGVAAVCLTSPFVSAALTVPEMQAQVEALLGQIALLQNQLKDPAAPPSATQCPVFTRTLTRGSQGDDVKTLQDFLKKEGVFNVEITGFFGMLTERAVQDWQAHVGIVWLGSPSLNGWGVVGPRTRAKILERCLAKLSPKPVFLPTPTPVCPAVATTTPTASCGVKWELVHDENCNASWKCAAPQKGPNRPPVLHDISGPSSIAAGIERKWAIKATDPDGDGLTFHVSWGEANSTLNALEKLAGEGVFSSVSSFTHTYYSTGSYIITVKVRDMSGGEAEGTVTVKVVAASDPACGAGCISEPPAPDGDVPEEGSLIFVPEGVTYCITPWGSKLVPSGNTVSPDPYFKGSVPMSVPTLKCVIGKWYRCDAAGANCVTHYPPASNPTMAGLQTYMALVGSSCGSHMSTKTVKTTAGSLICKDFAGAPGVCAMAQEDTAINLHCAHTNWAEDLTF